MIDVSEYMEKLDFLEDWIAICVQRKINALREVSFYKETGFFLHHHYFPTCETFDEYVVHRRKLNKLVKRWEEGVDLYSNDEEPDPFRGKIQVFWFPNYVVNK